MMRTFLLFARLSLALATIGASAATNVTLQRDGAPVAGGEVCRFAAQDRENPFRRWLASQNVTCVAAGAPIAFPRGLWNVFGRSEGEISAPVLVDGEHAPEQLPLSLAPAATLTPQTADGQTAVFYAPRRGIAFPFTAAMQSITVPASEELWAMAMEKGQVVSIVPVAPLEPHGQRTVDVRGSAGGPFLLGWLRVPEEDRAALKRAQGVTTPRVHLTVLRSAHESDPLPPLTALNGAFFLVRGVPPGDGELDLAGRGWIPFRLAAKTDLRAVTTVNAPLLARAAASLFVNWSTVSDLRALDRTLGSCGASDAVPLVDLSVAACAKENDDDSCRVLRHETFVPEQQFGTFRVDDIPPGTYRVEMRFGKLPPVRKSVDLRALQQLQISVIAEYIELYGSLTHGGELLPDGASLKFPDGLGFAERATGEYHAVLLHAFDTDARIDVASCGGDFHAFVLAPRGCTANARYDIDIPDNELRINVIDTFTRMPLGGATVKIAIISSNVPRHPVVTLDKKTEAEGRIVLQSVPERELRITVTRAGYQKQELKPFTMPASDTKTVDVELLPLRGASGRIVSSQPFDRAAVSWFSPAGMETEHVDLEPDGTFLYANEHGPDETMAVVSLSHPLWIARAPSMNRRETVTIPFPVMPVRTFDIRIPAAPADSSLYVGLFIGGVRVPSAALRTHQELRDLPFLVRNGGPLRIRDVIETGPIELVIGPRRETVPAYVRGRDPMAFPPYTTSPRTRLPAGATSVILE